MHADDWIVARKCPSLPVFTTHSCQQILPLNSHETDTTSLDLLIPPSKPRYQSKQQSSHYSIRHQLLAHHPERKKKKPADSVSSLEITNMPMLQTHIPQDKAFSYIYPSFSDQSLSFRGTIIYKAQLTYLNARTSNPYPKHYKTLIPPHSPNKFVITKICYLISSPLLPSIKT